MPYGSPSCGSVAGLRLITLKKPSRPSNTLLGTVIPLCASCAVATGVGGCKGFPVEQCIGSTLPYRGVATDCDPDRVHHLLHRQPHQAAGAAFPVLSQEMST
jgi:hypothetical protein